MFGSDGGVQTHSSPSGQPQITYGYDDANRLTQITQGTSTVGFTYDDASRRATLTLSNGVNVTYSYDNDSRVKNITYKFNAGVLGDLAYTYDELGRRTLVGGSFARTGLPGTVASATYDAANELTNWNGTTIGYDLNGNMLSDGTNAFTWNARDQVATLNGAGLQYDAFGRRTQNLLGTSFLYDGANAAQDLSGTTATANMLTGGIDEFFSRTDSSGSFTPLVDALGSTIALVDGSGNLATSYTYDPFGNTTVSGALSGNPSQYTGRENEGNGLYFYRARYYSPLLGRFVSEDPLGSVGSGLNLYAYVGDDPVNLIDPFGLKECLTSWHKMYIIGHGLGNLGIGLAKGALGIAIGTETAGLGTPVAVYLAEQGGANAVGGLGEIYAGITGNAELARGWSNFSSSVGTISGMGTMIAAAYRNPSGTTADMLEKGAKVGVFENMLGGFLVAPYAESALEGAAVAGDNTLVHLYDTTSGAADASGLTDDQYSPGRGCACK